MKKNIVKEKSFGFAVRVVNLYKRLSAERKEFVLSKQLLRSGTAVGALYREAEQAESKADLFIKWPSPKKNVMNPCIGWSY